MIWALDKNDPIVRFKATQSAIASIANAPGGDYLVTGGEDGSIQLWAVK